MSGGRITFYFISIYVRVLHYINTFKQELSGTKAYKETSEEEESVVNGHCNHLALKFSVCHYGHVSVLIR